VHFSGHGGGPGGLCFEDQNGLTHATDTIPLAKLLHHFRAEVKCVVLNACYSEHQAEVIRREIDTVVGMNSSIDDGAAIKFAIAFYDAIFAGTDFRAAFDLACTTLELHNLPDTNVPVILFGNSANKQKLLYNAQVPDLEQFLLAYVNTPYLERARLTTTGDAILPMVERHYGDRMLCLIDTVRVNSLQNLVDDIWRVAVTVCSSEKSADTEFYCRVSNRSILLEWEASVGLWSVPLGTFIALGGAEVVARVEAELDDYYNFDFQNHSTTYQSIKMRTITQQSLHGYVQKHTALHGKLWTS